MYHTLGSLRRRVRNLPTGMRRRYPEDLQDDIVDFIQSKAKDEIYMKRISKGRFPALWRPQAAGAIELTSAELQLFLQGCRQLAFQS